MLGGLYAFAAGFAVAGVLVLLGHGGPAYFVAVTIGLLGIAAVGFFSRRGTVPLPDGPVWGREGFAALARPLDLPARPVAVVFYVLVAFGVLANFFVPLFLRR
jgi:hypothetical protein